MTPSHLVILLFAAALSFRYPNTSLALCPLSLASYSPIAFSSPPWPLETILPFWPPRLLPSCFHSPVICLPCECPALINSTVLLNSLNFQPGFHALTKACSSLQTAKDLESCPPLQTCAQPGHPVCLLVYFIPLNVLSSPWAPRLPEPPDL